jgi:AbrB family looped-hinge helix DNA binding protein
MPLVKVVRNGQITIPKELRAILDIQEGDVLEITLNGTDMIIKPKIAVDKDPTRESFFAAVDEIRAEMKDADPEQITKEIEEAVAAVKKEAVKRIKARTQK